MRERIVIAALGLALAAGAGAAPSASPEAVVDAFHAALAKGDTAGAAALLADDALIFEEGGAERSKAEYAARHLPADAEFSKAVRAAMTRRASQSAGGMAWVASEGRVSGVFHGKAIDRVTTETMILHRTSRGWRIMHVHWSSATAH
ncbi:MAG TPA: nuclear transport factor 2 family protein [Sphingomicrobium sp.]